MRLFTSPKRTLRWPLPVCFPVAVSAAIFAVLCAVGLLLFLNKPSAVAGKVNPLIVTQASVAEGLPGQAGNDDNTKLQELLDQIVRAKGNYAIAVSEPNGRSAQVGGEKQFTSASTYKLFVAYAVFRQIDAGAIQWSDQIMGSYTAQQCFELMIVNSNNECARAFGRQIGWAKITDMVHQLGLASTHVEEEHHKTTANDLALFLSKLENGSLLPGIHRTKLLDAMKRQAYRAGIPAGTGVTVADKVGFLDGLLHDAAIVYAPKGPYILVILSNGSTWSQLADAAKQIHVQMEN